MTAALEGGEWSAARPGRTLPPGKNRDPFYRRLGGSQSRLGGPENLVPTGIRSRTVQTHWGGGINRQRSFQYYAGILLECLRKTSKNTMKNTRQTGPSFEPGTNRIQSRNTDSSTATFYSFLKSLLPSGCLLMDMLHVLCLLGRASL